MVYLTDRILQRWLKIGTRILIIIIIIIIIIIMTMFSYLFDLWGIYPLIALLLLTEFFFVLIYVSRLRKHVNEGMEEYKREKERRDRMRDYHNKYHYSEIEE